MISANGDIVLYAVGDVGPDREDPSSIFLQAQGMLNQGDITFCQLEANLSDRGSPSHQARLQFRVQPEVAQAIKKAGFKVVSFASNHCMALQFAMDLRPTDKLLKSSGHKEIAKLNPDWLPDPEYPSYFLPPDSRKTVVIKCIISNKAIKSVSYLPTYINKKSQPEILSASDPRFNEVTNYIDEISKNQELNVKFDIKGNEVFVS